VRSDAGPWSSREFLSAYISGYVDGEGCFTVSISPCAKLRVGWEVRPSFSLIHANTVCWCALLSVRQRCVLWRTVMAAFQAYARRGWSTVPFVVELGMSKESVTSHPPDRRLPLLPSENFDTNIVGSFSSYAFNVREDARGFTVTRINACSRLPGAYRRAPRPSSARCPKASTDCP
jgi:hypothetical protein